MKAPMRRVLPTPVARAKQREGNSRSKSVTEGYSLRMTASWSSTDDDLPGGAISVMR